jgi:hypothetical protein
VESYREAAGITDPAQAIGPVPSGIPQLREAFHASVIALQLPDDQALLRAMGRGELEGRVAAHDRAIAVAPRDVQPEIGERERDWQDAQAHAHAARYAMDAEAAAEAEARASDAAEDLTRLAVADAARREWAEAHAGIAEAAREAEGELQRRGNAERVAQAEQSGQEPQAETDEEFQVRLSQVAEAEARAAAEAGNAQPEADAGHGQPQPEPEPFPAMSDAEFGQYLERLVAKAEGREWVPPEQGAEPEPAPEPLSEAEFREQLGQIVRDSQRGQEPEPEGAEPVGQEKERLLEGLAEIQAEGDVIETRVEQLPDRDAVRRAEVEEAGINEPVMHERQAQPELESAWQPGDAGGQHEADAEAEIEM